MPHNQKESEKKGKALQDERDELKQKARDIQERRDRDHVLPGDGDADQVPRPAPDDPRHGQPTTPAGQANVPAGGSTGGAMGGSTRRKKDHTG